MPYERRDDVLVLASRKKRSHGITLGKHTRVIRKPTVKLEPSLRALAKVSGATAKELREAKKALKTLRENIFAIRGIRSAKITASKPAKSKRKASEKRVREWRKSFAPFEEAVRDSAHVSGDDRAIFVGNLPKRQ